MTKRPNVSPLTADELYKLDWLASSEVLRSVEISHRVLVGLLERAELAELAAEEWSRRAVEAEAQCRALEDLLCDLRALSDAAVIVRIRDMIARSGIEFRSRPRWQEEVFSALGLSPESGKPTRDGLPAPMHLPADATEAPETVVVNDPDAPTAEER